MKKILVLFILFSSISFISHSQNWKNSYDNFMNEFQEQNYDKAIETGNKTLALIGQKDTNYYAVLRFLAFSYYSIQDYNKSVETYKEAQLLCQKLYGTDNINYILVTYNLAINYTYIGKYSLAYPLMTEALDYIIKNQGKNSMDYFNIANQEANIYNLAGSYDKAEQIYNDIFEVVKNNYKETDTIYMQSINIIAPFYVTHGMYDKAEPFYTGAVDLMEKTFGKKSENYIGSLKSLGEFYNLAGKYEASENEYLKYKNICADFYGKENVNYADALDHLAIAYVKQKKYSQAEETYLQTLNLKEKIFKKVSKEYAMTLTDLAVLYNNMQKYKDAEQILEQTLSIYKNIYGESTINYINAVNKIATIFSDNSNYNKAIELTKNALNILKELVDEKTLDYAHQMNNLAIYYEENGDYLNALELYEKAAEILKDIKGENDEEYAIVIFNIGNIKMNKGGYSDAEILFKRALDIKKRTVGEYDASYANILNSLGGLYSVTGNYQLAGETYKKCKKIYEKVYGDMHPEYGTFLRNYGLYFLESGDYGKSEEYLKKSLEIKINAFGKDHPDIAQVLSVLGNNMMYIGNNKKAEEYLTEAVRITKEKLGINHPEYATSLLNLGVFYYKTGNFDKCEKCYLEVLDKYKKIFGEKSSDYATILSNLGTLYLSKAIYSDNNNDMNDWANNAIYYFNSSLKVDSVSSRLEHPDHAAHLNNLAELYRNIGNFTKAEPLYLKSIEIEKKLFGENYPELAVTYHNLALLYNGASMIGKAEEYCLKALKLKQLIYGENNPECSETMFSLAYIYVNENKNKEAEIYYTKAMQLFYEQIKDNFSFLSENEKADYLKTIIHYNDMFISFAIQNKNDHPDLAGFVYNNELINKGLLLQSSNKMKDAILNGNDKELINTYNEWIGLKQQLAKLYSIPVKDRYKSTDTLEEQINIMEKDLVSRFSGLKKENELFKQDWTTIKKNLKTTDVAIEFLKFNYIASNPDSLKPDSILYAAVIIRPDNSNPKMITLCSEASLKKMVGDLSWSDPTLLKLMYKTDSKKGLRLYDYIWKPLEQYLAGAKNIYYSPVGILNQISFSAIPMPDKKLLSDNYNLNTVTSTRVLSGGIEEKPLKFDNAVVYGGIQYDGDNLFIKSLAQNKNIDEIQLRGEFDNSDSISAYIPKWNYLSGTATETQEINSLLKNKKINTTYYTGYDCLEERFKENKNSPSLIHIATHGFSFPEPDKGKEYTLFENSFIHNMNPLFRSGLLFSGANRTWSGAKPIDGIEDGVLTAYEVSNLNLSNTKLVVLSACETGLGELKGNEGVYGLERAFKMAGVKYIIMSLWQVPDAQTVELMDYFYKEMLSGKPVREAFRIAQNSMKLKYEPYYWAAFVLVE